MYVYESNNHLAHYGVLGMKWGVRRYENKDGTLTPAGKKRYNETKEKYDKKVSGYRYVGSTKKEAEFKAVNDLGHDRAMKALAVVGTAAVAGAAVLALSKAHRFRVDRVIKAGVKMQRITSTDTPDLSRAFYTAYKKGDVKKYEGLYAHQVAGKNKLANLMGQEAKTPYKALLKTNADIRVASRKNSANIFNKLYDSDPDFKQTMDIYVGGGKTKKGYEMFNRSLANHTDTRLNAAHKKFYDAMKKEGYDAVEDINDLKYSGYRAKDPLIVFNNADNKVTVESVAKINEANIDKKYNVAMGKLIVENQLKDPLTMGTAVGVGTYGAANSMNSRVEDYKDLHPNTTLTDAQIEKMLKKYE